MNKDDHIGPIRGKTSYNGRMRQPTESTADIARENGYQLSPILKPIKRTVDLLINDSFKLFLGELLRQK